MFTEEYKWARMCKRLFAPVVNDEQGRPLYENGVKINHVPGVDDLKKLLGDSLIKIEPDEEYWVCEFKQGEQTVVFIDDSERLVLLKAYLELSIIRID